ncbi:hypothetical protein N7540_011463 [Penicillium herquei]|nr:hypothetical protein N7540_011463 [Penicillium herquei]
MIELDFSSASSVSSSTRSSPSFLHIDSEGALLSKSADVIQDVSSSCLPSSGEICDICTPCDEDGSSSSSSSISLQPCLNSKAASERSSLLSASDKGLRDCLADHFQQSSNSSAKNVAVSRSTGPENAHVDISGLIDMEQAASVHKDITHMRKQRKEKEKPSFCKRDVAAEKHTYLAVEIPPPRRHDLRSMRPGPEHITSDDSPSESSSDNDDPDDENFTIDTVASQVTDVEARQSSMDENSRSIRSSSYCSVLISTRNFGKNDIIGRAILTIENLGPEPTYFITFMPDNACLIPPVLMRGPRTPERPTEVSKRVTRRCAAPRKGRRRSYSTDEELLPLKLKEEKNLIWKETVMNFPGRNPTKLRPQKSNWSSRQGQKRAKRGKYV